MLKLITFSLFLFIFFYSNVFAATYKYLCQGDGTRVVLQFDESKKLENLINTEIELFMVI